MSSSLLRDSELGKEIRNVFPKLGSISTEEFIRPVENLDWNEWLRERNKRLIKDNNEEKKLKKIVYCSDCGCIVKGNNGKPLSFSFNVKTCCRKCLRRKAKKKVGTEK